MSFLPHSCPSFRENHDDYDGRQLQSTHSMQATLCLSVTASNQEVTTISDLKREELKGTCHAHGLAASGSNDELVARLFPFIDMLPRFNEEEDKNFEISDTD